MTMEKLRLSKSKAETFLACRTKYDFYYNQGIVSKGKTIPLMVGDITHQLLQKKEVEGLTLDDFQNCDELVRRMYPEITDEELIEVAIQSATLVAGHIKEYEGSDIKVIGTEVHLEVEEPDFFIYARIDGLCQTQDERLWRLEYKTTARTDSAFLMGLKGDLQTGVSHHLLKEVLKKKISGTVFDLLVKTKVPQYYRNPVPYSQGVVDRALRTMRGVARDIHRGDFYPSSQCFTYNRECEYRQICDSQPEKVEEVIKNFYELKEKKV